MSVYVLVLTFALSGQVAGGGDRYGAASSESSPALPPPPVAGTSNSGPTRERVSPPPAFTPQTPSTPATSADNYNYGTPATRPTAPPAASRIESRINSTQLDSRMKPSVLMRTMLVAPSSSRLAGRPMRLAEVVVGASTRQEQSQRVEAYWDLCSSVADYYLGVREQDELQRLRSSAGGAGPAWEQASSELGIRLATSERAAIAAQYRLASFSDGASAGSLPLPTDLPHCGDYYARYDQVFAGRDSREARELSELLPMRYEELADAAQGVTRAEEFLAAVAAQRGGDGTGTLRALELLALRRRAFVQIARDYNRRIARYTELATPGHVDSERLISMLIMRDNAANTATRPASLVPPPNRQSQLPTGEVNQTSLELDGTDQTFAEGWESIQDESAAAATARDESVQPASAEAKRSEPRREHSLLVPAE
jgi:hypothetical protein